MNLKYIFIVVILAVLVGGGILVYQYWWIEKEEIKIPEVKPLEKVEKKATDWKTYRNEQYGFELKYPADWSVKNLGSNLINKSYKGTGIPVYKLNVSCDAISFVGTYDNQIEIYDPSETNNKIVIFLADFTGHYLIERQIDEQSFSAVNIDNLVKFQNGVEQYRSSDEIFESIFFDLSQLKSSIKLVNKNYLFAYENKYLGSDVVPTECVNQHSKTDFVAYESIYEPLGKKLYRFIQINMVKDQPDVFNGIKSSINFF